MFENLLERIAQSLKNAGIPYMVSGGQADLAYVRHWLVEFSTLAGENYLDRLDRILGPKTI